MDTSSVGIYAGTPFTPPLRIRQWSTALYVNADTAIIALLFITKRLKSAQLP